jgi:hypothetical protein
VKFKNSEFFDTFEFLSDFEDVSTYYLNVGDDLVKTNNIVVDICHELYSLSKSNMVEIRLVK